MADFLTEILERKKREAELLPQPVSFRQALTQDHLSVIAEIKRRSPSKGVLNSELDPVQMAKKYAAGGASAISVLTDEGFGGTLQDLKAVVDAAPGIAVLRKDFIVDLRQVYETARSGAHAVLLIVAALKDRLPEFIRAVKDYGLDALVEVHDLGELKLAQDAGATIIGVNNRNLSTFEVSLKTSEDLAPHFLPGIVKVAESGIESASHAALMRKSGYDAILVGEALVRAKYPQSLIEELRNAH